MSAVRTWPAACASLLVLVVAGLALMLTHQQPREPLPASTAIARALRNPQIKQALAGTAWTSAKASPVDGQLERVSFYAGSRVLAYAAERADGTIEDVSSFRGGAPPWGDWLAYEPAVLAAFAFLFALAGCVVPFRRVRNLDVLAALVLLPTLVLFAHAYLDAAAVAAVPPLGYFVIRCARRGLGFAKPPLPSTPVFDWLTRRWPPAERVRLLRVILAALALVFVMVGVSSAGAVDVVYAVMEGATRILHGVLPYGHMPGDVVHGDTYPILSYALYTPLALVAPVNSTWSSVDLPLAVSVLLALAVAGAFARSAGAFGAGSRSRAGAQGTAGLRAAIAFLSFPSLLITVSTGTTDVALGAMLMLAIALWRRPGVSTGMLAVAGWFKLAPFALVPIWLAPRRGGALRRSLAALAVVSLLSLGLVVSLGGTAGVGAMVHAVAYQFDRESLTSPWIALGIANLQPLGEAVVLALIAGATVRLWRDREAATDIRRTAAIAASIMLALQLVADEWAFLYLAWVLPLIGVSLLTDDAPATVPLTAPVAALQQAPAPALAAIP